jgi:histidinol-phosphate/aromatic aminotransferase/cobyric acid decarboxylase-like protein
MRRAIAQVALYPDDNAWYFRKKVAERYGVEIDNVFAAAGSVEGPAARPLVWPHRRP